MTAEPGTFEAAPCVGICKGICVMLVDDKIVYAGPLKTAPASDGKFVLLHPEDYQKLRIVAKKHQH